MCRRVKASYAEIVCINNGKVVQLKINESRLKEIKITREYIFEM